MSKKNKSRLNKKIKAVYHRIIYVLCPAFNHEPIYFNRHGLRHMLYKYSVPRKSSDRYRRLKLLQKAVSILNSASSFKTKEILTDKRKTTIWTFEEKTHEHRIRVLVRSFESGIKHFYSVMDDK